MGVGEAADDLRRKSDAPRDVRLYGAPAKEAELPACAQSEMRWRLESGRKVRLGACPAAANGPHRRSSNHDRSVSPRGSK